MTDLAPRGDAPPNIYQRINAVRAAVRSVEKGADIKAGGGSYKGVLHDDVTDALRDAMIEHGIARVGGIVGEPRMVEAGATARGSTIYRYEARYAFAYVNVDQPDDRVTVEVEAHANDQGDKAPGKCFSYAAKYADLKTFGLASGENEEERVEAAGKAGNIDQLMRQSGALRDVPVLAAVLYIKQALAEQDIDRAAEAYAELTKPEIAALYLAPSKGGVFTTDERATMKASEFTTIVHQRRVDAGWHDRPENAA